MAARMEAINKKVKERFGLDPMFDLFWNFCVNAPYPGVPEVKCRPHVDAMNGAILLCAVLVYYIGEGGLPFDWKSGISFAEDPIL